MDARKGLKLAEYVANYLKAQDHNSLDEEREAIETFEFEDFEPFMVSFWRYRPELSKTEKQSVMMRGLINLRENPHMEEIMGKMFDFDLEISDIEKELFSVKEN